MEVEKASAAVSKLMICAGKHWQRLFSVQELQSLKCSFITVSHLYFNKPLL